MNILAIDTSNQLMGVAILKDEIIIGETVTNIAKNHSVRLMPAIDQLMREVSITPEQLNKVVVAKGPGSYTGVRIGLATAKTLAWALNIPITGVSSLEALAYQGKFFNSYICPFFDARREMVYTGLYQWKNSRLIETDKEKNVNMDDWLHELSQMGKEILFLSPDIHLYKEKIISYIGSQAILPEGPFHQTSPSHLALAGKTKPADDTHLLTPNYLRLAEAEANWLKSKKGNKHDG
ncbi:tRNA (adenosine(37)-N6)-threonylcarbamoyltransferase complex dimerization subunit type 1 TsaB [Virgibacillus alimentarius]|uniref:tRNA threonylcarbamoyladenosine biosynthesis protein TsaB n=1 Tax=Virgibacillus alimentarius TaxID=698769 RepID=A0ABS4SC11_9BACI|nr:tRNA (adenosine(37)-N6)-threonylcarbamoyltransferase complex dimerization subunit type 1 TsaB [Virgibacillus alimentarius]MBP2259034.1 tRNA threonylcarbamoyladenosine biosynthesis protein TsaB [Virgibacillus alimentarius]